MSAHEYNIERLKNDVSQLYRPSDRSERLEKYTGDKQDDIRQEFSFFAKTFQVPKKFRVLPSAGDVAMVTSHSHRCAAKMPAAIALVSLPIAATLSGVFAVAAAAVSATYGLKAVYHFGKAVHMSYGTSERYELHTARHGIIHKSQKQEKTLFKKICQLVSI